MWSVAVMMWMAIMLLETVNRAGREVFVAAYIGSESAKHLGVLASCIMIFIVAWLGARWLNAPTRRLQLLVGALWCALTLSFEFAVARAMGVTWAEILSDYNPAHGRLMTLRIAFMFCAPMLASAIRLRDRTT